MGAVRRCPRCTSEDVLPILYGLPSPEPTEESIRKVRGRVVLGGSVAFPDSPDHACRNCGYRWREDEASA
jgi:hypothetical protein